MAPNASTPPEYVRVDTDLLIPGRGNPVKNATLIAGTEHSIISDERRKIPHIGSTSEVPSKYAGVTPINVPVLMPGLWDAHVHYFGQVNLNLDAVAFIRPALSGMRAARDVVTTLNAGFTSVREVGGYGIDFSQAINEGWIPGPHVYSAGAPISQTAGHGDLHTLPLETMHHKVREGLPLHVCDGVEEAIKAVRLQIRRGAKVIKICATGGVLSRIDSPKAAQFNNSELEAIVEEATRTNMYVAAHAHGTEGIIAALRAGVKTIEHGSYLTDEAIELMKEKGAILVATRFVQEHGCRNPHIMPEESFKKILKVNEANKKSYEKAIKSGVKCALGTDLGVSDSPTDFSHGMNGEEFGYAVEAGMTTLQAIEAGTANGPDTLGPQAPLSGQLKEGYDADFIALSEDPLEDITVLANPEKITHVWKGARCVKSPGKPVTIF